MKLLSFRNLMMAGAFLLTAGAIALAQVPGINSPFQMVYTYAFDNATNKATYSAQVNALALATSAETVFQINGSSTKLIRIRRVYLSGSTPVTALAEPVFFNKVSSAMPSTGTSSLITAVPYDASSSAATAVVESFTANPTASTLVGEIMTPTFRLLPNSTAQSPAEFLFGAQGSNVILRSATQGLAINLGHVTTSAVVSISVEWTEE